MHSPYVSFIKKFQKANMRNTSKLTGFSLIELLVVVSIIGLLSSMVMIQVAKARMVARDTKRASDIQQISKALDIYFIDNDSYPHAQAWTGNRGNLWGPVTSNWAPGRK